MARDLLRVWMKLDHIHCYDEADGWGDAEPYLWTVFFKIDGESVTLTEGLTLSGTATVIGTPGSHGNLGTSDVDVGDDVSIPDALGEWSPYLSPIKVPESLQPLAGDDLGGVVGVVCVLMEEDNVTDDGAEAGHAALNSAVQSALDDIIATRSFSNPDITDAEIDAYMDAVSNAVEDAVKSQQNFFEDIWSFLNSDDTIGTKVFYFKHDDLAMGDVLAFSQRWGEDGDWEIFGNVNASVVCPAEALATLDDLLAKAFRSVDQDMRDFRDTEFAPSGALPAWWALAERNTPQLLFALSKEPVMAESAVDLLEGTRDALERRDEQLPERLLVAAERILERLHAVGGRRTRLDASRALAMLAHLRGKTTNDAVELLSSVPPSRKPRPRRDVRHLVVPELRPPSSLLQSVEKQKDAT